MEEKSSRKQNVRTERVALWALIWEGSSLCVNELVIWGRNLGEDVQKAKLHTERDTCVAGGGLVTKSCPTVITPCTVAWPLSMVFPWQENWSRLPFPSPGDLPDSGIQSRSPALQVISFYRLSHQGSLR